MKKILLGLLAAILILGIQTNDAKAQGFEKGKIYIDLGVGVPRYGFSTYYGYYGYDSYKTPTTRLSIRYGFNDFISGGLYAGYAHHGWKHTNSYGEYNERYTYVPIGVGASFHVWSFLNKTLDLGLGVENLDLYVTLLTGAQMRFHSEKTPVKTKSSTNVTPYFGSTVGGRYFFTKNIGAFLEVGYGMSSYLTGGITFKF